jgi:hypothetical protein
MPRGAEAAHASLGVGELVDDDELDGRDREHDELRDPHSRLDHERLTGVGVEQVDQQLAAVARVDETRRVDDRDPVLRRQARPRLNEARVPLRDRDREPRGDERPLARREDDAFAGGEVEAGVALVRACRQDSLVPEPLDRQPN